MGVAEASGRAHGARRLEHGLNQNRVKEFLNGVEKYLQEYIDNFHNGGSLCFMGNPKIITRTMARTCKEIYDRGLFKNRVCLLDVPSYLIGINSLDFGDRSREEAKINENLINSDLFLHTKLTISNLI